MMNGASIIGHNLADGWIVKKEFGGYTGNFAKGYVVENPNTSTTGYLKLCDLERANIGDPALFLDRIKQLVDAFYYERNLVRLCIDKRLSRVVRGLDEGQLTVSGQPQPIPYIIFEFADDISKNLLENIGNEFNHALSLRCIHGAFVGVNQLHKSGIAHQDIKPSNVLLMHQKSKIGDLGRSSKKGEVAVHDSYSIAGDPSYSPLELMYGAVSEDWNRRRFACDMYMLGGMLVFYLTNKPITSLILEEIDDRLRPLNMAGSYDQAIPHLRDTMNQVYQGIASLIPEDLRDELLSVITQMTDPDPAKRGWPRFKNRVGNQYNLDPYISKIANLTKKAEFKMKKTL